MSRTLITALACSAAAVTCLAAAPDSAVAAKASTSAKPSAVIFDGPSVGKGCAEPFVRLFKRRGFEVQRVGPGQSTPALLRQTTVYVVPGGEDIERLQDGWTKADRRAIRDFVKRGGRYYGVCLGGYWAAKEGTWPGTVKGFKALDMLPAKVLELDDRTDKVVDVSWNGKPRHAYFQDGPSFVLTDPSRVDKVYGVYRGNNGDNVAAFISRFGKGKVAVTGVHLEAPSSWYQEYKLPAPRGLNRDLQAELLDALLK